VTIDLQSEEILNQKFPNRELKEKIFNVEQEESGVELPANAKKYLLDHPFGTVREMVERIAIYASAPSETVTEELFEDIFNPSRSNVILPKYFNKVSCGFASPAEDYKEGFLSLDEKFVSNSRSTIPVEAEGDCMRETIHDGDILLVDWSLQPKHKDIVLAVLDGEFTMKRLYKEKNSIRLVPDNPVFSPIEIVDGMQFEIRGVVTSVHRDLR
tara:strand:- start:3038 stop:3676 length:639 start_codon:yes stop_codon:yes gene_type:complete